MASQVPRPRLRAAGKSKTDLRRGQFTPGISSAKKAPAPRGGTGTTRDEQAMLLDEPPAGAV